MWLEYTLHNAGWAEARIGSGQAYVNMTVSDLHDSLRELAKAVLQLQGGANEALVIFMDEPGEHHLIFEMIPDNHVRVEVRWYDDWASWGITPGHQYEVVFEATTLVKEVVGQVLGILESLLREHGEVGYKQKWLGHDFPTSEYEQLKVG